MGKYKWRCNDPQQGGNTWRSKNANSCPTCGSEDIEIIAGPPPIWPWILGLLLIVLMAFLWINRCSIIPSMCDSDDDSYSLVVNKYDNYFEITTEPTAGYDKLNFYVVNQLSGRDLYSEDNKFYPCESGDFVIRWDKNTEMVINGDTIINNFKLKNNAHQNACERKLSRDDVIVNLNDFCENTILLSNFGENEIEVSINRDSGYKRGKIIWTESEVGSATNFYVRLINNKSAVVSKKIKKCSVQQGEDRQSVKELNDEEIDAIKSQVKNSFDLYMNDYENNRQQFSDIFDETNSNPEVIYDGAAGNELFDFIMHVNAMEDSNFRLEKSDIQVNTKGSITKLNIKRK